MTDINPVPIICQAREFKRPITFSFYELDYVVHQGGLHPLEKFIWMLLAIETNGDAQLACLLSYQHIAYTLHADYQSVHCALHRLVNMGFIQVSSLPEVGQTVFTQEDMMTMRLFMLSLPLEGLLVLKKAPSHKPAENDRQRIYRKPPILLNLLKNKTKQDKGEEEDE